MDLYICGDNNNGDISKQQVYKRAEQNRIFSLYIALDRVPFIGGIDPPRSNCRCSFTSQAHGGGHWSYFTSFSRVPSL